MTDTTNIQLPDGAPVPKESGISYREIGERLQARRIERDLTLAEAARQLHLPGLVLNDLEGGRIERLAPLYRRGYIKNYALLLGLDPAPLLAGLEADEPPGLTEVLPVRRSRFRFDRYMKVATYLIVTTVIVPPLVMIYLHSGANLFEGSEQTAEPRVASRELDVTPPEVTGPEPRTSDDGQARHVSASALPLAAMRPLKDAGDRSSSTANPISPGPDLTPALSTEQPFELVVRLREDSWIEIAGADGERLEYDLLRAGQERRYQGEPPFRILLGRASSVDLLIGGEVLDYEGSNRGDVAELTLLADGNIQR